MAGTTLTLDSIISEATRDLDFASTIRIAGVIRRRVQEESLCNTISARIAFNIAITVLEEEIELLDARFVELQS